MVKGHYTISADVEVWEQVKKIYPNQVSTLINEYLGTLINVKNKDTTLIEIEVERLNLKRKTEEFNSIKLEMEHSKALIEEFEKNQEKKKEEDLIKQKEEISKQTHCYICGTRSWKILKGKPICKPCYYNQ